MLPSVCGREVVIRVWRKNEGNYLMLPGVCER